MNDAFRIIPLAGFALAAATQAFAQYSSPVRDVDNPARHSTLSRRPMNLPQFRPGNAWSSSMFQRFALPALPSSGPTQRPRCLTSNMNRVRPVCPPAHSC